MRGHGVLAPMSKHYQQPMLDFEGEAAQRGHNSVSGAADGPVEGRSNAHALDRNHQVALDGSSFEENDSTWQEVPAALFLSWSAARQYEYCARRDEDAMLGDDVSDWWMSFYAERAVAYRTIVSQLVEETQTP